MPKTSYSRKKEVNTTTTTTTTTGQQAAASSANSSSTQRRRKLAYLLIIALALTFFALQQVTNSVKLLKEPSQVESEEDEKLLAPFPNNNKILVSTKPGESSSSSSSFTGAATAIPNSRTTSTTTAADPPPVSHQLTPSSSQPKSYYELTDEIIKGTKELNEKGRYQRSSWSAYRQATIFRQETTWFPKRKQCKATCCVETIAISLQQDKHKIINTQDGRELADLTIEHYSGFKAKAAHLKYHANQLREDMIPCLVPGTIIWIENHDKGQNYFWNIIRPKIKVPYSLIVSVSDGDTPRQYVDYLMADPLLLKSYGTNPKFPSSQLQDNNNKNNNDKQINKFQGIGLGLGHTRAQELHLYHYLKLTNFTNPFLNKTKRQKPPIQSFQKNVFVHFGLNRPHRKHLWSVLCPSNNNNNGTVGISSSSSSSSSSCNPNTHNLPIHTIFTDMSKYRFGISPTGYGWDCYRTYEMLLLGVIPIIEERKPDGYNLFKGLPVIHMPNMSSVDNDIKATMTTTTKMDDFVQAINKYIASDAFQKADFEQGWKKLFLQYKRRMILKDSGRDKEILKDEMGREYYQAYRYTTLTDDTSNGKRIFCENKGSCEIPGGQQHQVDSSTWLQNSLPSQLTQDEKNWLSTWSTKKRGG